MWLPPSNKWLLQREAKGVTASANRGGGSMSLGFSQDKILLLSMRETIREKAISAKGGKGSNMLQLKIVVPVFFLKETLG